MTCSRSWDGRAHGYLGAGRSAAGVTRDQLAAEYETMPFFGPHSVTVPGAVDGWDKMLKRFGTKGFAELLAPAIQYSEEGFGVGEIISVMWRDSEKTLSADAATAKTYMPNGRAPRVGEFFKNPDLAWTYRQIAEKGRDAFYKGEIAQKILATMKLHGGTMQAADLAEWESEWVEPISTTYRGWTVWELPPNGQGIAALEMLNIMETYPLKDYGHNSVKALHAMIEAK